ncbi:MAG TPA: hypothetical protein DEA08_34450 [Planctomycetes bacterium]|nr:hypothetical protein [Planctomycetota bacterium]
MSDRTIREALRLLLSDPPTEAESLTALASAAVQLAPDLVLAEWLRQHAEPTPLGTQPATADHSRGLLQLVRAAARVLEGEVIEAEQELLVMCNHSWAGLYDVTARVRLGHLHGEGEHTTVLRRAPRDDEDLQALLAEREADIAGLQELNEAGQ